MPPSKRKARRKPNDLAVSSDLDLPDSSPSRPSAKKRKVGPRFLSPPIKRCAATDSVTIQVNGGRAAPSRRKSVTPEPEFDQTPTSDSGGEDNEEVSRSDLIDSVVSYLQISKEPVSARTEYANDRVKSNSPQKVSAYAKIAGRDWTYFVREQSVNFGRPPDDRPMSNGASSPIADMKEMLPVHIDLGPSKIVSRHHASVYYDGEYPEGKGGWHVRVNGRNGVRVNNALIKKGLRKQLKSGDILEIAGTQMMFVTPGDEIQIDPYFIERSKALAVGEDIPPAQPQPESPKYDIRAEPASSFPSLAPAPLDFKRETTPPAQLNDGKSQRGVFDSKMAMSPMYGRGMMMESTQEIDYSRDSAKDLKPPFSYAIMIAQAIFSSEDEKMTLANIYSFIADKYAFYRHSNSGWQVSNRELICIPVVC